MACVGRGPYYSSMKLPQSTTSPFVMAALFAAMMGAMVYLGISQGFPPAFLGAAIFLAGIVVALRRGLRRR